jgi:hypothetical protein
VFQATVISITKGADLSSQDLVDGVHGRTNQWIWFPCPLHENSKRSAPGRIQLRTFIAMDYQFGMVLSIHAVVWKIQGTNLPKEKPERVDICR